MGNNKHRPCHQPDSKNGIGEVWGTHFLNSQAHQTKHIKRKELIFNASGVLLDSKYKWTISVTNKNIMYSFRCTVNQMLLCCSNIIKHPKTILFQLKMDIRLTWHFKLHREPCSKFDVCTLECTNIRSETFLTRLFSLWG